MGWRRVRSTRHRRDFSDVDPFSMHPEVKKKFERWADDSEKEASNYIHRAELATASSYVPLSAASVARFVKLGLPEETANAEMQRQLRMLEVSSLKPMYPELRRGMQGHFERDVIGTGCGGLSFGTTDCCAPRF